jgi:hypothetical protein
VGLSVSKSSNLNPSGETIGVNGSGYVPGIQVYVTLCNPAAGPGAACDMAHYRVANVDGNGNFSTALTVFAQFGATDCMAVSCAVQTSRVGMGADRSQEGTAYVGFAAPPPPPPPPPAAAPGAGGATATGADATGTSTTLAADTTSTTKPGKRERNAREAAARSDERADVQGRVGDDDGGSSVVPYLAGLLLLALLAAGITWFIRRGGTPADEAG